MLNLFAAALCSAFIANGHRSKTYWAGGDFSGERRAFWNAKAAEILPGVLAAGLWKEPVAPPASPTGGAIMPEQSNPPEAPQTDDLAVIEQWQENQEAAASYDSAPSNYEESL